MAPQRDPLVGRLIYLIGVLLERLDSKIVSYFKHLFDVGSCTSLEIKFINIYFFLFSRLSERLNLQLLEINMFDNGHVNESILSSQTHVD